MPDLPERLEGEPLPITQEGILRYARLSNDFNPLHTDPEFARRTPYGGTIAHGTLNFAPVLGTLARLTGDPWLRGVEVTVRFIAPARPGDTLTPTLERRPEEDTPTALAYRVACRNQEGQEVLVGTAHLPR